MFDVVIALATQEAVAAGYAEITPAHLLIALSRLSEPDVSTMAPADSTAIQCEFEDFGVEPHRFRRRLRALLGHGGVQKQRKVMHHSPACRAVFAWAERIATAEHVPYAANHLVQAAFMILLAEHGSGGGAQAAEAVAASTDVIPSEL